MSLKLRTENGSIIVLAALLISVVVGMAALGVELTFGSASLEQSRHNAKLAAIGALEAYASDNSGDEAVRRAAALTRANEILQTNYIVADRSQTANSLTLDGANGTPKLVAGRWYYQQLGAPDPCGGVYPCFVAVQPDESANAFKIVGELFDAVPARFAQVLGFDQLFNFNVDAIATMVPRQGCFLVDISASMVRETHLRGDSQFAFDLNDPAFNALADNRGSNPTVSTVHYEDDYQQFTVYSDAEETSTHLQYHPDGTAEPFFSSAPLSSRTYLIDTFRDNSYQGPEPLRTVFEGLLTALEAFKNRAVDGDKACIIFYDNALAWPRVLELTDDFDYLLGLTDFSIPQSGVIDLNQGFGLMMRHGLFPAAGSNTDMRLAIINALGQLSNRSGLDESVPVSNFIVLIGDGLTTCSNCLSPQQIASDFDLNNDGIINWFDHSFYLNCRVEPNWTENGATCTNQNLDADGDGTIDNQDEEFLKDAITTGSCNAFGCANNGNNYYQAMNQLVDFVDLRVASLNIPIHVVHVGSHVAPHTVDRNNASATACMTDAEMRTQERSFVQGGAANGSALDLNSLYTAFNNMSPQNPFYEVASPLYKIATMTGGIWAPLRPPGPTPCVPCQAGTLRRLTDNSCRSKQQQMNDYMEKIIGETPYQIVQER